MKQVKNMFQLPALIAGLSIINLKLIEIHREIVGRIPLRPGFRPDSLTEIKKRRNNFNILI